MCYLEYAQYKLQQGQEAWSNLADGNGMLSAERLVQTFADLVKKAIDDLNQERKYNFRWVVRLDLIK